MKKIIGLLVVLLGIFAVFASGCTSEPLLQVWNTYEGEFGPYTVKIDETMEKGVWTRMVFLEPMNESVEFRPNPFAMTGHDYDGDGRFDRVFIRRQYSNGYDSVYFAGKGKRVWECSGTEEDIARSFSDKQLASAQADLYQAYANIHNKNHLVATIESPASEH